MKSRLGIALSRDSLLATALLLLGGGQALAATTTIGQLAPGLPRPRNITRITGADDCRPRLLHDQLHAAGSDLHHPQDYLQASVAAGGAYVVPANGETIDRLAHQCGLGAGQEVTFKVFRKSEHLPNTEWSRTTPAP